MKIKKIKFGLPLIILLIGAAFFLAKPAWVKATATAPELPRSYIDTTMPASASTCTVTLNTGGNIQTAINNAALGDTICLTAGSTYEAHLTLPNKTTGSGWITIRTTAINNLPAGYRISPSSTSSMAKIYTLGTDAIVNATDYAHHYRFSGIEFYADPTVITYDVFRIGNSEATTTAQIPHDITIDRSYIHCGITKSCKNGLTMNGTNIAVIDSYIEEMHSAGQEAHAISFWNTNGPIKIVNNFLSGAGMEIFLGGAAPGIPGSIPADIEISRNWLYKPLRWFNLDPSWDGSNWDIKNHFEIKYGERVLFEKNILENVWADAQIGWAIIFNCFDFGAAPTWCRLDDITIRNNIFKKAAYGIDFRAKDTLPNTHIHRVLLENNIWLDLSAYYAQYPGGGHLSVMLYGPEDVNFNHNTVLQDGNIIGFDTFYHSPPDIATNFTFTNNIVKHNNYGMITDGTGLVGLPAIATSTSNYLVTGNAIINKYYSISYPNGNFYPATTTDVGFTNLAGGIDDIRNYALTATSTYHNAATDGTDVGANITTLYAATNGVMEGTPEGSVSASDTIPPVISSISASSITQSGAIIGWSTNELSDTQVEYGPTTSYGQSSILNSSLFTSHSFTLSALSANTVYHYRVKSRDAAGNIAISADQTFTTLAVVPIPGDLNLDHVVNVLDFSLLNSKWLQQYPSFDLQADGIINSFDFAVLSSNWGKTW